MVGDAQSTLSEMDVELPPPIAQAYGYTLYSYVYGVKERVKAVEQAAIAEKKRKAAINSYGYGVKESVKAVEQIATASAESNKKRKAEEHVDTGTDKRSRYDIK
jgi:hypothetical protein